MDKKKIDLLKIFAQRKRELPEWREFKAKWDGKQPRQNSKKFTEYADDSRRTNSAVATLASEVFGVEVLPV